MKVHAANIQDREGAKLLLSASTKRLLPRLQKIWADQGYTGALRDWLKKERGWDLEVVHRPSKWGWFPRDVEPPPMPTGFIVLPRRWVVERTFGWMGRQRRLSKDYEQSPEESESWVYLAMIRLLVARLAKHIAKVRRRRRKSGASL